MRHIKTRMLTFTSVTIILSCLLINLIATTIFSKIYIRGLYSSYETQARQVQQSVDQRVQSLEDSMQLLFTNQETASYLTLPDFSRPDGKVYHAYRQLDWILRTFARQFPEFQGLLFFNGNGGVYKYNYYNPQIQELEDFFQFEGNFRIPATDRFRWEGICTVENQLADKEAYVVTRTFIDYQDLKDQGVLVILLDADLFSSIYQPMVEASGTSVYLFDQSGDPVEAYPPEELQELEKNLAGCRIPSGVFQTKAADNRSVLTVYRSPVTGWSVCAQVPIDLLNESIWKLVGINTLISVIVALLFGLVLFRYISHITNDIATVANAMQVVEENNFTLRLHTRRKDEIGLIYEGFNAMAQNLGKYFQKAMEEEKNKNEAEIRAMFYQIKPHFLYNTLASIRMYAMKQGCMEIVDMLGTLNRLLRNTINIKDHFIPVEEELRNLRDYIKIYNVRYNNRIQFVIDAPEELLQQKIPNMVIQPIVENAIEHGVSGNLSAEGAPASITIKIFRDGEQLDIQVYDNGAGMTDLELAAVMAETPQDSGRDGHIGIYNIDRRLKSLYGEEYGVEIQSKKNQYTCVTLKLMLHDSNNGGFPDAENSDC